MLENPPGTHKWFLGQVQHMGREQWFSMPLKVTSDSITTLVFTESGEIGECYWLQVYINIDIG